jgi:hypothetical protein
MTVLYALVLSLPTRSSTLRMRVWRALKETGCGVLRDGVYVLPAAAPGSEVLSRMEAEIRAAGGFAMAVELKLKTAVQRAEVRKLFDRSAEYGQLVEEIKATKPLKRKSGLSRLQRSYERLIRIDFFPGRAQRQAKAAMLELAQTVAQELSGGEPRPANKRLRTVDAKAYQKRVWATRKDPWVDRLASAWLIKRFIDREARFAWIERPRDRPGKAVGFDFDGAEFTHVKDRVTFEVLLASFRLGGDPALARIGAAVHFLDTGGIPVADARGLETVLLGAREKARDDDALLNAAMRIFDLFYSAYAEVDKS